MNRGSSTRGMATLIIEHQHTAQAYGKTTYLITTLGRVPRGTEGAISAEGTLAGAGAALAFAALAAAIGQVWGSADTTSAGSLCKTRDQRLHCFCVGAQINTHFLLSANRHIWSYFSWLTGFNRCPTLGAATRRLLGPMCVLG